MQIRRRLHAHAVAAHIAHEFDDLAVGDAHVRSSIGIHLHGIQVRSSLGGTLGRKPSRGVRLKGPVTAYEAKHPRTGLHHGRDPVGHATQTGSFPHVACQRDPAAVQGDHRLARARRQRHARIGPAALLELVQIDPKRLHLGSCQIVRRKPKVLAHATRLRQTGKNLPTGTCAVMLHGQHGVAVEHARIVGAHDCAHTAVGLQIRHVGQHEVRSTRRLGPANINRHEQVELLHNTQPSLCIAVSRAGITGIDDEPTQIAGKNRLTDGRAQAAHWIDQWIALGPQLELTWHRRRRESRRVQIAQGKRRGRVEGTARMSDAAQQHIDQADSTRRLRTVGIRDTNATMKTRIHHSGRRGGSEIARRGDNLCGRHVAHRLGPLGRPSTGRLRQLVKTRGIAVHELVVVQALGNQHVDNTQQQRQVAARPHAAPAIGNRSRPAAPRGNHDDFRPTPARVVERIDRPHRRRIYQGTPQIHDAIGMCQVGSGTIAQAVLPTSETAYLAGAIGTVHVGRAQRMHKTIRPVAVERGHTKCHAQRTGPALVNNSQKPLGNLRECIVPAHRIEPRAISSSAHGMQNPVALVKRHCQAMAPAGAQGTRRARMSRHRQLGNHATVLNACRKGAIGIASPACRHHGATVTLHSRCHLDYPFHQPNTTGQKPGNEHQTQKASRTATPRGRPNIKQTAPYASDFLA